VNPPAIRLDLDEFPFLYTPGGSQYQALGADHVIHPLRSGDRQLPYYVEHTGRHYVSLYPVIAVVLAAPVYLLSALCPLSAEHDLFEVLETWRLQPPPSRSPRARSRPPSWPTRCSRWAAPPTS
jgi:hypothetical protein